MKPPIHQILIGASPGDAITGMALQIRDHLRRERPSEVFALHCDPRVANEIRPLSQAPDRIARGEQIIYHASFGEPEVTRALLRYPRLILVYHNITPSHHFVGLEPEFAMRLEWGRSELELIRDRVVLTVADSEYNRSDIESMGYTDVHVIPAGLQPSRLSKVAPDPRMALDLRVRFPYGFVLAVAQLLPHKDIQALIATVHLLRWVHNIPLGLVVIGPHRIEPYRAALEQYATRLRVADTWLTGGLSDNCLASAFRMARAYVSASKHEGLALPPLEAMSFGVPVLVREAGAIGDTVSNGGIRLPASAGPALLSETLAHLHDDAALRRSLIRRGKARIAEIERREPVKEFAGLLSEMVGV